MYACDPPARAVAVLPNPAAAHAPRTEMLPCVCSRFCIISCLVRRREAVTSCLPSKTSCSRANLCCCCEKSTAPMSSRRCRKHTAAQGGSMGLTQAQPRDGIWGVAGRQGHCFPKNKTGCMRVTGKIQTDSNAKNLELSIGQNKVAVNQGVLVAQ